MILSGFIVFQRDTNLFLQTLFKHKLLYNSCTFWILLLQIFSILYNSLNTKNPPFCFQISSFLVIFIFEISFQNVIHNAYPIHSVEKMARHQILIKVVYFVF